MSIVQRRFILVGFLVLGCLLRLVPVLWGIHLLPHEGFYYADEAYLWDNLSRFPQQLWGNSNVLYGKTLVFFTGLLLLPFHLLVQCQGFSLEKYTVLMCLVSRIVTIAHGIVAIYFVYKIAEKLFNTTTAMVSSLLLTFSVHHVLHSAFAVGDVPIGCWCLICFFYLLKISAEEQWRDYFILGVSLGFLLGLKPIAGVFFVVVVCSFILDIYKYYRGDTKRELSWDFLIHKCKYGIFLLSIVASCFIIINPEAIHFLAYYKSLQLSFARNLLHPEVMAIMTQRQSAYMSGSFSFFIDTVVYWFRTLSVTLNSSGVLILALVGALFPGRKYFTQKVLLALFPLVFSVSLGWLFFRAARYALAIIPILYIFAAWPLSLLIEHKQKYYRILGLLIVGVLLCGELFYVSVGLFYTLHDTRTTAAQYIESTISPGTSIGVFDIGQCNSVPIDAVRYHLCTVEELPAYVVINWERTFFYMSRDIKYDRWTYRYSENQEVPVHIIANMYGIQDHDLQILRTQYKCIKSFYQEVHLPLENKNPVICIYQKVK